MEHTCPRMGLHHCNLDGRIAQVLQAGRHVGAVLRQSLSGSKGSMRSRGKTAGQMIPLQQVALQMMLSSITWLTIGHKPLPINLLINHHGKTPVVVERHMLFAFLDPKVS